MQRRKINDANVIIVAAGASARFGRKTKKIFFLLDKKPVIIHTIEKFKKFFADSDIIIVVAEEDMLKMRRTLDKFSLNEIRVVKGGEKRCFSVFNGLKEAAKRRVFIHDGARPFLSGETILSLSRSLLKKNECVAPAYKPSETVRIIKKGKYEILDRQNIFLMQTPQACFRDVYLKILEKRIAENKFFTDDAEYFINENMKLKIIDGDKNNIKITFGMDIKTAEKILKKGDSCS
jgi:2-C-methyl-D-erythritol 4-phosphate cytidylyltransferase